MLGLGINSLLAQTMIVYSPNGGEVFESGGAMSIRWDYASANTVQIAFSTDNGSTWANVGTAPGNASFYNWTSITTANSTNCRIKVFDISQPLYTDISNASFTVLPAPSVLSGKFSGGSYDGYIAGISGNPVQVNSPNGGEIFMVGGTMSIRWNYSSLNNVQISYSTDNGSNFSSAIATVSASSGFYNWTSIANAPGPNWKIRVVDAVTPSIGDTSDLVFTVIADPGTNVSKYSGGSYDGYSSVMTNPLRVLSPNGGEVFEVGGAMSIRWDYASLNNISIAYSTDNGSNFSSAIATVPASSGYFNWTSIANAPSAQWKIRIWDVTQTSIADTSDVVFTVIATPTLQTGKFSGGSYDGYSSVMTNPLKVLSPNGGEVFEVGGAMSIRWDYASLNTISIAYSSDNGSNFSSAITSVPANSGYFNWGSIANAPSTQWKIRVWDVLTPSIADTSDLVFTVNASPTLQSGKYSGGSYDGYATQVSGSPVTVLSPNGGETYYTGGTMSIRWNAFGISNVRLSYSTDNGSTFSTIATVAGNTGFYNWASIANAPSSQWIIRIQDDLNLTVLDLSDAVFTVLSQPTLNATRYSGGSYDGYAKADTLLNCLYAQANLSGNTNFCSGGSATMSLDLGGAPPWNFTYTDGTSSTSVTGISTTPFTFSITPAGSRTYTVTTISNGCGSNTGSGQTTATLVSIPAISISGTQTICSGGVAQLSAVLTGGGSPWAISWTDGTTPVSISGITSSPYVFTATPSILSTYSPLSVFSGCAGTLGSTAVVTLFAPPTAQISGSQTICAGGSTTLSVQLSGASPWQITYSNGTSNQQVSGITTNPYVLSVTPLVNTTYTLTQVTSNCAGSVSGSGVVTVSGALTATLSGTQSICPGNAAQLTTTFTGLSPYALTWTDGTTPVTVTGITTSPYLFTVTPTNTRTYQLVSVNSGICSGGGVSGNARVNVYPVPTAQMSGAQTLCAGNPANLSIALTGTGPWQVTWTDGTTPQTQTGITAQPYQWSITPANTTTYLPVSVSDVCTGTVSGNRMITVQPIPTVVLSGNQTLCASAPATLTFALTGVGPWNLTWTDGTTSVTQTQITSQPYQWTTTPLTTRTYSLQSLSTSVCSSGSLTGQAITTVLSSPTATLTGAQSICAGSAASLTVQLTSNSPWSFTYTDGTTSSAITGITSQPYILSVTPTSTRTYTLTQVNNSLCAGSVSGSARVQVDPTPIANLTGSQTICVGSSANLSVGITGSPPYQIVYSDGTTNTTLTGITQSPYVVSVTPTVTTTYSLNAISSVGCSSGIFSGTPVITVLPLPTATGSGNQNICIGNSATLSVALTGNSPWNVTYSNGTASVTMSGITTNPYQWNVTPTITSTYIINNVTNLCGAGTAAGSQIISVNPLPTAAISGTQTLCAGNSGVLTFTLTGSAPWNVTYSDGITPTTLSSLIATPYTLTVTPSVSRTYTITQVSDAFCSGTGSGSALLNVLPLPTATISGSQSICLGSSGSLSVQFTGGNPWQMTWSDGTTPTVVTGITQSPYVWQVTPTVSTTYSIQQVSNFCGSGTFSGSVSMNVRGIPTASLSGSQTICPGNAGGLSITLSGAAPWALTYSDGFSSYSVAGITASPWVISISPIATRTYTLTSITDQCSGTVSGQQLIYVNPVPTANISGTQTICQGNTAQLSVQFSGTPAWNITWTDGVTNTVITGITSSPYLIALTPTTTRTYQLLQVSAGCVGTFTGSATVQVDPISSAVLSGGQTICAGNSTQLTVQYTGLPPWNLVLSDGTNTYPFTGQTNTPHLINLTPTGSVTYQLQSVSNACGAGAISGQALIHMDPSPSLAQAGLNQQICGDSVLLGAIPPTQGTGIWTVLSGTGILTSPTTPVTALTGLTQGQDTLVWTTTLATCSSKDTLLIRSWHLPDTANAGTWRMVCGTSDTLFALPTVWGSGTWILIAGGGTLTQPQQPITTVSGLSPGQNLFLWRVQNGVCPASTDTVSIISYNGVSPALTSGDQTLCGNTIQVTSTLPTIGTGVWQIVSGPGQIAGPISGSSATLNFLVPGQLTTLAWTITNGACISEDTLVLTPLPLPTAAFTWQQFGMDADFDGSTSSYTQSWVWDFGDGDTSHLSSPHHTWLSSGFYPVTLIAFNSCGTDTLIQWLTIIGDSRDDLWEGSFYLYPNPSSGKCTLKYWPEDAAVKGTIHLSNAQGVVLQTLPFVGEVNQMLDLTSYARGIYWVTLNTPSGKLTRKLTIY
ncbi:MAG: T9SS C-terminal target domain-containing protein [Sphingobacteriia bacterium]|nr:T9SS C-terminal target domain-containing protein [Sphingobacteriia bacterium]